MQFSLFAFPLDGHKEILHMLQGHCTKAHDVMDLCQGKCVRCIIDCLWFVQLKQSNQICFVLHLNIDTMPEPEPETGKKWAAPEIDHPRHNLLFVYGRSVIV